MKDKFISIFSTFRRMGILTVFLVSVNCVFAQQYPVELRLGDEPTAVGEIIRRISDQASLTFAYDSKTFDTLRVVTPQARVYSLEDALKLITDNPDRENVFIVRGDYVVISSSPKEEPVITSRTGDLYLPSHPDKAGSAWSDRTVQEEKLEPQTVIVPEPVREYPAPYSDYRNPNLYASIQDKLPLLAVKVNLLYGGAFSTPNLSGEIGLDKKTTLEFGGSWNRFKRTGTLADNKKFNHWMLRSEARYWLCERYDGHFFGLHAFYADYNISQYNIPLLFDKEYRYEGTAFGVGITYGYHLPLSARWGVEFHVGVGVAKLNYEKFDCTLCSNVIETPTKTYFGPTRAGISLVFDIR